MAVHETVRWDDIEYVARLIEHNWGGVAVELFRLCRDSGDKAPLRFWKRGECVFVPVDTADESEPDAYLSYQPGGCYDVSLGRYNGGEPEVVHFCDVADFEKLAEAVRRAAKLAGPLLSTETPERR